MARMEEYSYTMGWGPLFNRSIESSKDWNVLCGEAGMYGISNHTYFSTSANCVVTKDVVETTTKGYYKLYGWTEYCQAEWLEYKEVYNKQDLRKLRV